MDIESTQPGDSVEVTDVESAANALKARYESHDKPVEEPIQESEIDPEVEDTEDVTEEADAEENEAEASKFETLSELAEATGMELDEFLKTVKTKTKVNGEESEVNLADLIKGYQLESVFTRKNEEFLNQQKQWEAQREKAQTELKAELQRTGHAFRLAQSQLTHEFNAIDWNQLQRDDPTNYVIKRQQFGERQAQLDAAINQATQQAQEVIERQNQEASAKTDEYLKQQDKLLLQALPEWNVPETRSKQAEEVAKFLSSNGWSPEEISEIRDHRVILMARKAMKADSVANSADLAKKKVKTVPKLLKPNASHKVNQAAQQTQKLMARAKKTGRVEDIQAALLSRRG